MYNNTGHLQPHSIPKCYGYVKFLKWPRIAHLHKGDQFRCDETAGGPPITWGLILDHVAHRTVLDTDRLYPGNLYQSGLHGLKELHKVGIVYGNAKYHADEKKWNVLIVKADGIEEDRIVFIDFGRATIKLEVETDSSMRGLNSIWKIGGILSLIKDI